MILESIQGRALKRHVVSVDEKTSIQALERIQAIAPESKGAYKRTEFEYIRHGTTTLMAAVAVGTGELVSQRLHPTRKEADFVAFITTTLAAYPKEDEVVILADQLNTHLSEGLLRWVAQQIGFEGDLGTKAGSGILKSMESRKAFLQDESHRIRFVYTPKHCSWLNPIENWFAKLQRHVIRHGNFPSVEALEIKIKSYISFYNQCLLKPLKWKFSGFIKANQLKNINYQKFSS